MSGANASPIGRSHQTMMSGANASPIGRSHQTMMSGANASPTRSASAIARSLKIGRSHQEMEASGIPIYRVRQGKYEVAGFESGKYTAYVISDLDRFKPGCRLRDGARCLQPFASLGTVNTGLLNVGLNQNCSRRFPLETNLRPALARVCD